MVKDGYFLVHIPWHHKPTVASVWNQESSQNKNKKEFKNGWIREEIKGTSDLCPVPN